MSLRMTLRLSASRLVAQKGCVESIAAFAEVAAVHPDASLDVYGDGPARGDLMAEVAVRQLGERVRFHGHVDSATLATDQPALSSPTTFGLHWSLNAPSFSRMLTTTGSILRV